MVGDCFMVESYKFKSKLANFIVFSAGLIVYMGKDVLVGFMPVEYANFAPLIVLVAGYVVVQSTENTRVCRAEELVREEYTPRVDVCVSSDELCHGFTVNNGVDTGEPQVLNDESDE